MENFIIRHQWGTQSKIGEHSTEGYERTDRGERMEEAGNTQGRMEASSEGGQGPDRAVAPWKKKNYDSTDRWLMIGGLFAGGWLGKGYMAL